MADNVKGLKYVTTIRQAKRIFIMEIIKEIKTIAAYKSGKRKKKPYKAMPVYIEGIMGMGKSQSVYQAREDLSEIVKNDLGDPDGEFGIVEMRFAGKTSSDIQGIPVPAHVGEIYGPEVTKDMTLEEKEQVVLKWLKDTLLPGILKTTKKYGIFFADEINQVDDPAVASLLYQFLLDRRINDYELPENWFIVCAGNREEDGGIYNRLPAPIRDRMLILEVAPNLEEWIEDYAIPYQVHPAVITFLRENPSYFHTYNKELEMNGDPDCENYVFASPRSWTFSSDDLYTYEDDTINRSYTRFKSFNEADLLAQISGLLGKDLGLIFKEYYIRISSIQLADIYSIDWMGGEPQSDISHINISPSQFTYLTCTALNLLDSPTKDVIPNVTHILLYLEYRQAPVSNMSIIKSRLTSQQKEQMDDIIGQLRCSDLMQQSRVREERIASIKEE